MNKKMKKNEINTRKKNSTWWKYCITLNDGYCLYKINIKMDKNKPTERIDGAVALVMALDRAIRNSDEDSVYNERGLIII